MDNELKVEVRHLRLEDYIDLRSAMEKAYSDTTNDFWEKRDIRRLLNIFPDGQLCVAVNDKVVALALSLIVDYKKYGDSHTYSEITADETFKTYDEHGDVLYGIEMFVHPDYRGMRLGRRLYDARKELCENLNLRAIMAGGRIPNYAKYADKMNPREYINSVRDKQIYDPTLTFQFSNNFHVKKILKNYLPEDEESKEYATLLEWNNIYYQEKEILINVKQPIVRLGLVQWQMRSFPAFEDMIDQAEFFIDAVSGYQADFILFPEFFNAPLMSPYNNLGEAAAIRKLAGHTEELRKRFVDFSISYNVNIISGSMPIVEDDKLYNISFLCRRDGSWESIKKIHITPNETETWGMTGGDSIQVFDTDSGKIGIAICYDIEFPELIRIYADQGMQILFVPFLTDTQNGYSRVRRCAQARAIENECYVAIAGCVGNLPRVNNMDIQYAQSAVFTPSDFAFPTNAIKSEATPNTEMTLIVDVDLNLLKDLHYNGTVRTLTNRRNDLYEIKWKKPGNHNKS